MDPGAEIGFHIIKVLVRQTNPLRIAILLALTRIKKFVKDD